MKDENGRKVRPNKSLHWPPGGSYHGSCNCLLLLSQEPRQLPGASELNR